VAEGDQRRQPSVPAAVDDPAAVVGLGARDQALLRLDPRPLEGEPVGGEAGSGEQVEILPPAVVVVHGVAAGLGEQ